jgi:hypothetical protein
VTNALPYALLAYMLIDKLVDVHLTRSGLRTLIVRKPPEPRRRAPAPEPQAATEHQAWSGDGYRPQTVPVRRTS